MADRERPLGVIEALVAVRDQCPNGSARAVARAALETISRSGAQALPDQAYTVLSAIAGWRGERAHAVKRALEELLESTPR